jgi:hypothetical protein
MYTLSQALGSFFVILIGIALDKWGPRNLYMIGCAFVATSMVMFGVTFANLRTNLSDLATVAFLLLSIAGGAIFTSSFHVANCFPERSGLIVVAINVAYDFSAVIFTLLYVLFNSVSKAEEKQTLLSGFFYGHALICVIIFGFSFVCMPCKSVVPKTLSLIPNSSRDFIQTKTKKLSRVLSKETAPEGHHVVTSNSVAQSHEYDKSFSSVMRTSESEWAAEEPTTSAAIANITKSPLFPDVPDPATAAATAAPNSNSSKGTKPPAPAANFDRTDAAQPINDCPDNELSPDSIARGFTRSLSILGNLESIPALPTNSIGPHSNRATYSGKQQLRTRHSLDGTEKPFVNFKFERNSDSKSIIIRPMTSTSTWKSGTSPGDTPTKRPVALSGAVVPSVLQSFFKSEASLLQDNGTLMMSIVSLKKDKAGWTPSNDLMTSMMSVHAASDLTNFEEMEGLTRDSTDSQGSNSRRLANLYLRYPIV